MESAWTSGESGMTLERIPEPELMEDEAQGMAYAEADFSEPNARFLRLFAELFPGFSGQGRVLDLGCGPADILIHFATCHPRTRCLGIDGAEAMLAPGREVVAMEGIADRVQLCCHRLPLPAAMFGLFDVLLSNSLLHHLHDPHVLWRTVREVAAPGCRLLVMDLFRPSSMEAARHVVETYAGDEPEILKTDFYNSLLASFRVDEVRDQLRQAGLALECRQVSDRHLAVWGRVGA